MVSDAMSSKIMSEFSYLLGGAGKIHIGIGV